MKLAICLGCKRAADAALASAIPLVGSLEVPTFSRFSSVVYDNLMTLGCAIDNNEEHLE
jgi:hypothetical protein